ncbi:NB-ARC domain-containing protein [Pelatocladus sp. BLCC-F211]|uniref:nSTAND1 domain-containing NTPase n=1 Tax=Pelatocladus sp. BLCC-F211 TaxID=3342752 RepID=UPI0035B99868
MNFTQEDSILTEAIKIVDELLATKKGKHLREPEIVVIKGAWRDETYEQMAQQSIYKDKYLQHSVASDLWKLLSELLGNEVCKKNLRICLQELVKKRDRRLSVRLLGEPPLISRFFGREAELRELKAEIVQKRLVFVYGEPGIGKSALVARVVADISQEFDLLVWKSVAHSPSLEDLVANLHRMLNLEGQPSPSCLINQLRSHSCLLVLDGVEAILSNYSQRIEYIRFFLRLIDELDRIRLILTSRESFTEINILSKSCPIFTKKIEGLDIRAGIQIFRDKGLTVEQESTQIVELIKHYRGNPLELESVADKIYDLFGGDINAFWEFKTTFISEELEVALNEIFAQRDLKSLQREILIYLAEELSKKPNEPIKISDILKSFVQNFGAEKSTVIDALGDLVRRQIIEVIKNSSNSQACYILAPGVKKYILSDPLKLVRL